jgi:hypothetical protein
MISGASQRVVPITEAAGPTPFEKIKKTQTKISPTSIKIFELQVDIRLGWAALIDAVSIFMTANPKSHNFACSFGVRSTLRDCANKSKYEKQ